MNFSQLVVPSSLAVVGASANPQKVGYAILNNIIQGGYEGDVYAINPKEKQILGIDSYPSLEQVPGTIDCAVISIKKELVKSILQQCAAKGVASVIIITAGFGETGKEGQNLQKELTRFCESKNITMMGPNCLGLINPWHKLNAAFGQKMNHAGGIGVISQSGALVTSIQDWAFAQKIGFSILASIGNKASLDEVDFIVKLRDDPNTDVIAAYLEEISNGQQFMHIAEKVSKTKPIVILKSGRTSTGAKAASSHTGSLAGSDNAYDCAFGRTGVLRVESIEELFDISTALSYMPLPEGNNVAVVTNAGGPGIMMTDALESAGLDMAQLKPETSKTLSSFMPEAASAKNPVDVLGDADAKRYGNAIETLMKSDEVDAVIVILTPQRMTEYAETANEIVRMYRTHGKPILACFMGSDIVEEGVSILQKNKIPHYPIPERAARAIYGMASYAHYKKRPLRTVERFTVNKNPVKKMIRLYRKKQQYEIGEIDAKNMLSAYNFDLPPGKLVTSVDEAINFAEQTGYPLAMKISSPDILHKSDVGGVRIGLDSASDVADSFELMMLRVKRARPEAELQGVLLEKMVSARQETILGMKKDPQFGPMLMFGLGGVFVEILKDVSFSLAPITESEAYEMIKGTKTYKLLTGARGQTGVDIPAIVENIQRFSQLVMDFSEIAEIDINPLMVGNEGEGAYVVDARCVIEKE